MGDSSGSPIDAGNSHREQRSVPRYILIAQADIVEPVSGVHIAGRISEISRKGCYVDLLNSLPVQTMVEVHVTRDQGAFTSPGRIIYVQEGMGIGIEFLATPHHECQTLDSWLAELAIV